MPTELENLRRQVAVLEGALSRVYGETHDSKCLDLANDAIAEAERIAAEPTELTDREVVEGWCDDHDEEVRYYFGTWSLSYRDEGSTTKERPFKLFADAAAWVREQGKNAPRCAGGVP
jgi:hypothetical protein